MNKDLFHQIIVLVIVVCFLGLGVQPAVSDNKSSTIDYLNVMENEAKELLFHTIIDVGTNPKVP